jgi:hypothetical protein
MKMKAAGSSKCWYLWSRLHCITSYETKNLMLPATRTTDLKIKFISQPLEQTKLNKFWLNLFNSSVDETHKDRWTQTLHCTREDPKETRLVSLPPNAEDWEKDNVSACSLDPQRSVAKRTSSCNNAIGRTVSFREGSICDPVEIVMWFKGTKNLFEILHPPWENTHGIIWNASGGFQGTSYESCASV